MRNNFIEELFYGNIAPHGKEMNRDKHFQQARKTLSDNESILSHRLTGEEKQLFDEYVRAYSSAYSQNEADAFIRGFKIGARIIFDTFDNVDELMFI